MMRASHALALIGIALAVASPASAQTFDHLSRIERPDLALLFPMPSLAELKLSPETTRQQVTGRWGDGTPTMSNIIRYRLDSGDTIELLFSPVAPYGLVRARLLDGKTESGTLLFDDNRRARSRRYEQIAKCPNSVSYLYEVWGPADYEYGSGIGTYFYELADGSSVMVSDMSRGCRGSVRPHRRIHRAR